MVVTHVLSILDKTSECSDPWYRNDRGGGEVSMCEDSFCSRTIRDRALT